MPTEREIRDLKHQVIEQAKAWAKDSDLPFTTLLRDACADRLPARSWQYAVTDSGAGRWHLEIRPR